ncbi:MAG TPA: DUF6049 family protein [Acidimicrobiales bacterium]|nr:DUF6049 family protein [Acidimicrobiales bacterium]
MARRRGRGAGAVALCVALLGLHGALPATAAAAASPPSPPTLQMISQTPWVGPAGMKLGVAVHSAVPASSLLLGVVLYANLHTRYAFDESLSGPASGGSPVLDTTPLTPLSELHPAAAAHGALDAILPLPVASGYTAPPGSPANTLVLECLVGQCDGVYPMEVQLLDKQLSDRLLAEFTTYLIYDDAEGGTAQLDVGLVLPVGTTPALGPSGQPDLTEQRLEQLYEMLGELKANPGAHVTLEVYPQIVLALTRQRGRFAHAVLSELRSLLAQPRAGPPAAELLEAPFTRLDLNGLTAAGLGSELTTQLQRSAAELPALGTAPLGGTFVATSGLAGPTLATLAAAGIHQLVVPASDVALSPPDATFAGKLTLGSPASSGAGGTSGAATGSESAQVSHTTPPAGGPSFETYVSDPGLTPFLETSTADPVLAAHQLLAEIAMIYFEAPDDPAQRAVAVAPPDWDAGPAFVYTLLHDLTSEPNAPRPLAQAVTLGQLFALPPATGYSPTSAQLSPARAAATPGLRKLVDGARHELAALQSVVPGDATPRSRISDAILLAETAGLSPRAARSFTSTAAAAIIAEGDDLKVHGTRQITLTSATGSIPITIESLSRLETFVVVRLSSSTGLTFLSKPREYALHGDQEITLRIGARTSGKFALRVDLDSPYGGVLLNETTFQVISTAVSPVAIALSVGAALVLVVWWFRSSRRRRRSRRAGIAGTANGTGDPVPANM